MKRLIVVAILSSIPSLHAQPANARQSTVLDLTAPDVVRTNGVIGTEGGSTSRAKPESTGLEVRFVSSSQSEFHLGDRFAYELEVRNSGTRPVNFPFSPDLAGFLPGPNTTVATIHLEARRKDQRTKFSTRGAIPVNVVLTFNGNEEVRWLPVVSKNSLPFVLRR